MTFLLRSLVTVPVTIHTVLFVEYAGFLLEIVLGGKINELIAQVILQKFLGRQKLFWGHPTAAESELIHLFYHILQMC